MRTDTARIHRWAPHNILTPSRLRQRRRPGHQRVAPNANTMTARSQRPGDSELDAARLGTGKCIQGHLPRERTTPPGDEPEPTGRRLDRELQIDPRVCSEYAQCRCRRHHGGSVAGRHCTLASRPSRAWRSTDGAIQPIKPRNDLVRSITGWAPVIPTTPLRAVKPTDNHNPWTTSARAVRLAVVHDSTARRSYGEQPLKPDAGFPRQHGRGAPRPPLPTVTEPAGHQLFVFGRAGDHRSRSHLQHATKRR